MLIQRLLQLQPTLSILIGTDMRIIFIMLLCLSACSASAQLATMGIGPGGQGGAAAAPCGNGTITLASGCAFAMFGVM